MLHFLFRPSSLSIIVYSAVHTGALLLSGGGLCPITLDLQVYLLSLTLAIFSPDLIILVIEIFLINSF